MPFSNGTYSLYATGNPVVTGTTISSTWANNTLNDIATALSTCLLKDGTQTVTANIPFAGYRLTGIGAPTAVGDALREGSAIGGVTAAAGSFTTITASSTAGITGVTKIGGQNSPTGSPRVYIGSGALTAVFGADSNTTTLTDATNKTARLGVPHYTNAEETVGLIFANITSGSNFVAYGGGTATNNAATTHNFYTAADAITTSGTIQFKIDGPNALTTITGAALVSTTLTVSGLTAGRLPLVSTAGLLADSATFTYTDTAANRIFTVAGSGSTATVAVVNNTHASGDAGVQIAADGTGDAYISYGVSWTTFWYSGADNSNSDRFAIGVTLPIGTSDWLRITTAGAVTIPNLAGVGTRAVVVDANGVMSAP